MAARDARIREQLAGLAPLTAAERPLEILQAEEAQELAGGDRHLTVVHGYLERDEDGELLERLLEAMRRGLRWARRARDQSEASVHHPDSRPARRRSGRHPARRPPRELAEEAAAAGGWRWQVALVKHPRERW
jgi:hypothetical protein